MEERDDIQIWRPPLLLSASLACYFLWTNSAFTLIDQSSFYAMTLPVCLTFAFGALVTCVLLERRETSLGASTACALGAAACICNMLAVLLPDSPSCLPLLAAGSMACGCVALHWAFRLVTMHKGQIIPVIALAALICSAMLALGALDSEVFQVFVVIAPLLHTVFVYVDAHKGGDTEFVVSEPAHDKLHTVWPLPCAILFCSTVTSLFASLLVNPYVMTASDSFIYEAVFGIVLSCALLAWTLVAHRRNPNGFILAIVIILEIALLIFATGSSPRIIIPANIVIAVLYGLTFLVWILAAFLSRSPSTRLPYQIVFAAFLICGNGSVGHALGYFATGYIDIPFASIKNLAASLDVAFGIIFIVFFMLEVMVLRRTLETEAAEQVAAVTDRAAEEIATAANQAAEQVRQAEQQAAERIAAIQQHAQRNAETSRQECCDLVIERYGLTKREGEALVLLMDGKTRGDIANEWVVSENTVKYHLRNIYKKLDVHNFREAIALVENAPREN